MFRLRALSRCNEYRMYYLGVGLVERLTRLPFGAGLTAGVGGSYSNRSLSAESA